jgi:hypothetical protein
LRDKSDFLEAEVAWDGKAVEEPKGGGGCQEDEDQKIIERETLSVGE